MRHHRRAGEARLAGHSARRHRCRDVCPVEHSGRPVRPRAWRRHQTAGVRHVPFLAEAYAALQAAAPSGDAAAASSPPLLQQELELRSTAPGRRRSWGCGASPRYRPGPAPRRVTPGAHHFALTTTGSASSAGKTRVRALQAAAREPRGGSLGSSGGDLGPGVRLPNAAAVAAAVPRYCVREVQRNGCQLLRRAVASR
jgi:hypothetical protein